MPNCKLTRAMRLPTFTVDGMTLIKRMAWVIDDGVVAHVFYPVFPPDRSADEVVAWLKQHRRRSGSTVARQRRRRKPQGRRSRTRAA